MQKTLRIGPSADSFLIMSPLFLILFLLFLLLLFLFPSIGLLQAEETQNKAAEADALLQKGSEALLSERFRGGC